MPALLGPSHKPGGTSNDRGQGRVLAVPAARRRAVGDEDMAFAVYGAVFNERCTDVNSKMGIHVSPRNGIAPPRQ